MLLQFCAQHPDFVVVGYDTVSMARKRVPRDVLAGTELKIYEKLAEHGGALTGVDLERYCVERGMNRHTFWMCATFSPILARAARGVLALIGADVAPGAITELEAKARPVRRNRAFQDSGWTDDGRYWLLFKLSQALAALTMPALFRGDDGYPELGGAFARESVVAGLLATAVLAARETK